MCGRMAVTLPPDAMAQLFAAAPANDLPQVPEYNVCPTDPVSIVTSDGLGGRKLRAMRWGFIPRWYKEPSGGPLLINARAETLADKPAFRTAARTRRGLIIASGFYEWTKDGEGGRDPWYITRRDGGALALAAVWQDWRGQDGVSQMTCTIVTTGANAPMQAIHHRMPVIVAQEDWPLWLGERGKGAATLMGPAADDLLGWHRVGRAVNSNRASGADLVAPLLQDDSLA
ncbi:SOS response-associated peptidase [Sulfitobacter sp. M57]|uniref:SOS response-associated peptidase n=1 Tax=unclassified Sulfitobacter TaxID=196795 RepID=UPI0023E26D53|nr:MULTISPECIES: SOS response-associated peptidase [unclassified Sulfitobacter]MDF3415689.1 SOS response-associated peptidase [Sulfitobacter sp. KE5]MDF3423169.1 SOS response-associated peptidase [Sulfitobacter sp. KE43]MDF3434235.1 SOS response-associated peptidase [Sulfitobacter sp. KE42]MDF3459732.1 SOS response-associated peptidase [Sulfitobacter sp. S74]MDF3463773.1 SOS response-associated peptidase [Sulfitobacter sp. Ks18]